MKMFLCPMCEDLTDSFTWETNLIVSSVVSVFDGKVESYDENQMPTHKNDTLMCSECSSTIKGDIKTAEKFVVEVEYDDNDNLKDIKPIGKYWKESPIWFNSIKDKLTGKIKSAKEQLNIPIYYYTDTNGNKIYDIEEMRREFERQLKKVVESEN